MNKKNIALILIFVMFLSVMVMSLIGKNADKSNKNPATDVVFYDQAGLKVERVEETSIDMEKVIEIKESEDTIVYTFSVEINPKDTTDRNLYYQVVQNTGVTIEEIERPSPYIPEQGLTPEGQEAKELDPIIYKYKITFDVEHQGVTKIQFEFNREGVKKQDYLKFIFDIHHDDVVD